MAQNSFHKSPLAAAHNFWGALLLRPCSVPWPGSFPQAGQHEDSLPCVGMEAREVASCSLPNLIWRISLGLEAQLQCDP